MTPYWLDEPASMLPAGSSEPVDVGIVGAGITGCACALALAEAGLRVRVVDERRVAEGASGRNGGFALRGMAGPYDQVVADLGRERALTLWRWTEEELDAMAGLAGGSFRRLGSLRLAADAEEREELRDRSRRSGPTASRRSGSTLPAGCWPDASPPPSATRRTARYSPRAG